MRTAGPVALRAPAFRDDAALRPLVVALLMYVSGLTAGWFAGGVPGTATGGMCGTVVALGVLLVREAGRRGPAVHARASRRAAARRILTRSWRRLRRHDAPASTPRPEASLPPGTAPAPAGAGAATAGPHGSRPDQGASDGSLPQGSEPNGTPPGGAGPAETASHESRPPGSWPPESRSHVSRQPGTEPYRLPPDGSGRDRNSPTAAGPDETGPHETGPHETWPDEDMPGGSLPPGTAADPARAATAGPHGSRPDGEPRPGGARAGVAGGGRECERVLRLLVDAVWRGDAPAASDEELRAALAVARDNQVEGRLAQAYPRQLASTLHAVDDAGRLFRRNVVESTDRLSAAAVPTVLVKADLPGDLTLGSFDLVVPTGRWKAAQKALGGWYVERSTHWLERSTSVLLKPPDGPSAQLHTAVAWHGVSVMATDRLFAHAVPDHDGRAWLVPCPADRLRIWLALGIFRNQSLDLSELLALRELLAPEVVAEARAQTAREGWSVGGDRALELATEAMATLDRGEFVQLPLPLPVTTSLRTGVEHAGHLLTRGRASTAAREVALRVPLAVTERLRRRTS
ncbi:hypothetical protein [Streptomyces sp. NPDC096030]|uniref:hypothetical protein n=1 Tax=Streptomyces sp. NPDC096030 TaxID=3155423 RepID=UPI0033317F12